MKDIQKIFLGMCSMSLVLIAAPVQAEEDATSYDVTSASGYRDCLAAARDAKDYDLAKQCRSDRRDYILGNREEYRTEVKELNQDTRTDTKDTYRTCKEEVRTLRSSGDADGARTKSQECRAAMKESFSEHKAERQEINSEYGRRKNKGANRATRRVYNSLRRNGFDNAADTLKERDQERRSQFGENHPRAAKALQHRRSNKRSGEGMEDGDTDAADSMRNMRGRGLKRGFKMGRRRGQQDSTDSEDETRSPRPRHLFNPPPPMDGEHMEGDMMDPPPPPPEEEMEDSTMDE